MSLLISESKALQYNMNLTKLFKIKSNCFTDVEETLL